MPNPFAHVELSTDDVKKAKKFYAAVFAWKLNDLPAMSYTMIDVAGGTGGGIQSKQMPEQPTAWLPYVQVSDARATLAKVVKAGGTVTLPYHEIGDMGAIGIFIDPQGAALGVWEAKAAAPPAPEPVVAAKKAVVKKASKAAPPAPAKKAAAPAKKAAAPAPAPAKKAPAAPPAKKAPAKKTAAAAPAKPSPAKKR